MRVARRLGVAPGTLWNIRKGRTKGIRAWVEQRLRAAVIREDEVLVTEWINTAPAGERMVYWTGAMCLAEAAERGEKGDKRFARALGLRNFAQSLHAKGRVFLFQRREPDGGFAYVMQKRGSGRA